MTGLEAKVRQLAMVPKSSKLPRMSLHHMPSTGMLTSFAVESGQPIEGIYCMTNHADLGIAYF